MDLEAVLTGLVDGLRAVGTLSEVRGALTGERRSTRPQIRLTFGANGEERTFLYHLQREAPVHAVVRSMVDDTVRTVPQRILEPMGGRLQPNDVYYPSALGFTPTRIPGQASA